MDRDDARRRLRDFIEPENTTPAAFRHPAGREPLPAGDLAVIITRLRADLDVPFPEPIRTPTELLLLESVTAAQALAIADLLQAHFEEFEGRQGRSLLSSGSGRKTTLRELELHLTLVERYRNAERFFRAVADSGAATVLE